MKYAPCLTGTNGKETDPARVQDLVFNAFVKMTSVAVRLAKPLVCTCHGKCRGCVDCQVVLRLEKLEERSWLMGFDWATSCCQ